MTLDEILGQIQAYSEKAEEAANHAYVAMNAAEEAQNGVIALAGSALTGVAQEAVNKLGVALQRLEEARGAAYGAKEDLDTWVGIIASAGGGY